MLIYPLAYLKVHTDEDLDLQPIFLDSVVPWIVTIVIVTNRCFDEMD